MSIVLEKVSCFSCSHYIRCKKDCRGVVPCAEFAPANRMLSSNDLAKLFKESEKERIRPINAPRVSRSEAENLEERKLENDLSAHLRSEADIERDLIAAEEKGDLDLAKKLQKELDRANDEYQSLLDRLMSQDTTKPIDFRVNDSDFARAPNIFEFLTSPSFLAETPFVAQALALIMLFEDYCPRCSNNEYFHHYKVGDDYHTLQRNIALLEEGKCPFCHATKTDFLLANEHILYEELAMLFGQRSGKSYLTAGGSAYLTHYYLMLRNPQQALHLSPSTKIVASFVATKITQAKNSLYDPYLTYCATSPWFSEYNSFLRSVREKNGDDLVKLNETFVRYRHRGFELQLEAANGSKLRGATRAFGATDEIGHMDDSEPDKVTSASATHNAINRSLKTIRGAVQYYMERGRPDLYNAVQMSISSCKHARDKICSLYNESKVNKKILGLRRPTWDVNPTLPRSAFATDFARDPITAARDFGCIAPMGNSPFYKTPKRIKNAFWGNHLLQNGRMRTFVTMQNGQRVTVAKLVQPKTFNCKTLMALDAGVSNNSFGVSILGLETETMTPILLALYEVIPQPDAPIDFTLCFDQLIVPLMKASNTHVLVADRWQSIKLMSDAVYARQKDGVELITKIHSLRYREMVDVQTQVYGGTQHLPMVTPDEFESIREADLSNYPHCFANQPLEHFYLQMMTVRDLNGKKVEKGDGLTDDLFRSWCLGAFLATQEEFAMYLDDYVEPALDNTAAGVVVKMGQRQSTTATAVASTSEFYSGVVKPLFRR